MRNPTTENRFAGMTDVELSEEGREQTRCLAERLSCQTITAGIYSRFSSRRDFVGRPKRLVEDEDCLSCRYLSIRHGGCPVRTYSALGTMMAKDPYCEVYKAVFACAEAHTEEILRARAVPIISLRQRHEVVVSSTE